MCAFACVCVRVCVTQPYSTRNSVGSHICVAVWNKESEIVPILNENILTAVSGRWARDPHWTALPYFFIQVGVVRLQLLGNTEHVTRLGMLLPCKSLLQIWSIGWEVFGETLSWWTPTHTTTNWPPIVLGMPSLFLEMSVCWLMYHSISILVCPNMLCAI